MDCITKFRFGSNDIHVDITDLVYKKCLRNNIIYIPGDIITKHKLFGISHLDENNIYIINKLNRISPTNEFDVYYMNDSDSINSQENNLNEIELSEINLNKIALKQNNNMIKIEETTDLYYDTSTLEIINENDTDKINYCKSLFDKKKRLDSIYNDLSLTINNYKEDFPEELMICKYLIGNEKILQIIKNFNNSSLVIGYILNKNKNNNFVVLTSELDNTSFLLYNKSNLNIYIENGTLISNNKQINQINKIKLIDYNTICNKYNITFDTLIADFEDTLYNILYNIPEILQNINLLIMKNKYTEQNNKIYIDNILKAYNFIYEYKEIINDTYGNNIYFEIYAKNNENINININLDKIYNIKLQENLRLLNEQINKKLYLTTIDNKDNLSLQLDNKDKLNNELEEKINNLSLQLDNKDKLNNELEEKINNKDKLYNKDKLNNELEGKINNLSLQLDNKDKLNNELEEKYIPQKNLFNINSKVLNASTPINLLIIKMKTYNLRRKKKFI